MTSVESGRRFLDNPATGPDVQKQVAELQVLLDSARKGTKKVDKLLDNQVLKHVVNALGGEVYSVQLRAAELLSYLSRTSCHDKLIDQLWSCCLEDRAEICIYYSIRSSEYDACCSALEALSHVLQHGRYLALCWQKGPDCRQRNMICLLRALLDLFVHVSLEFNNIGYFRKAFLTSKLNESILVLAQQIAVFPWPLQYAVHLLQASNVAILNGSKELNGTAMTVLSFIVKFGGRDLLYGIKNTGVLNSIISALTSKGAACSAAQAAVMMPPPACGFATATN